MFLLHELGHLIAVCLVLRKKEMSKNKNLSAAEPMQYQSTVGQQKPQCQQYS